ncbi:lipoyl synthase [Desulfococcus sp.]|uniref:lipoyl synthase n=1 Tax=Desulfococcus sp. TaxID=2025834 RepID=UPI003593BACB
MQTNPRAIEVVDWGVIGYGEAFRRQKNMVAERIADRCPDRLLLVEHPPVVTLGRGGGLADLCVAPEVLRRKEVALHHADRGGRATFHGPGQLVAYPILKLEEKDLHAYLRRLLEMLADVLRSYGLIPEFREGTPGVWVGGAKIASVGIAVRKWVTYHGAALNVSTDPGWFSLIVPCGRPDERMTSIESETGHPVDLSETKKRFVRSFGRIFDRDMAVVRPDDAGVRPAWLVRPAPDPASVDRMASSLQDLRLATVCQSAQCPNLGECFGRGTATFMILGTRCTRRCRFCAVEKGAPDPVDENEPVRVARAVRLLGLSHAVVTSVTRDDLPDGGAGHFARTIRKLREACEGTRVEVLVPDFSGSVESLERVCESRPDVFNHNVETVARLYARARPKALYRRSLGILSYASGRGLFVKSGLMLGLGEREDEIRKTLADLKRAGCTALTLGQYLAPSGDHLPVARYVPPEEFNRWAETARAMGFKAVAAGPLVRSSYRADVLAAEVNLQAPHGAVRRICGHY